MSDLDRLRGVAQIVRPPAFEELLQTRRRRTRRARLAAASTLAVAATVLVGVLASIGGTVRTDPQPVAPSPSPAQTTARKIVYSDGYPSHTIHFGDRVVETGNGYVNMDVTDDGFVYATGDGRVWFSDGGRPEQIGSHVCNFDQHFYVDVRAVRSANAGSLVAWFDCSQAAGPALVVRDTGSGRVVVRQPMDSCAVAGSDWCDLDNVIGEHVYFTRHFFLDGGTGRLVVRHLSFDVTTGRLSTATPQSYAEDLLSHPRGLVVGVSRRTGTVTDGIWQTFTVVGSGLVPQVQLPSGREVPRSAFDTATGRAVELHLPQGYAYRGPGNFTLFEWLDNDTVALMAGGGGWPYGPRYGDILTCRLSDGRCDLTVKGQGGGEGDKVRIVPHLQLPG